VRGSRFTTGFTLAVALGWLLGASAAVAEEGRIPVEVLVAHLSSEGSGVDPSAERLDRKLRGQFKYSSLKVLQKRRLDLAIDEVGTLDLPNGKAARVRPISKTDTGVLIAVDVEGAAKMDVRAKSGHLIVIRAGAYEGGNLVLSLEPDYE